MEANIQNDDVAPFVMKTYQMVNDPATDDLISWGNANNSFVVADPPEFSCRILPTYFKHNNFSSFVRQLNTYGFKKVDPDKWEFASEWFLKGQRHLLKNISRKRNCRNINNSNLTKYEDEELAMEIVKLKQEQRAIEEEVKSMNKRLEATEKKPQQMMAFLYKIIENPEILPWMMLENHRARQLGSKRRWIAMPAKVENFDDVATTVNSSPEFSWGHGQGQNMISGVRIMQDTCGGGGAVSSPLTSESGGGLSDYVALSPPESNISEHGYGGAGEGSYFAEVTAEDPPYPFSLLSGGF